MKRYTEIFAFIMLGFALCGSAMSATEPRADEIKATIDQYFDAFYAKNLEGMVAVSSPTIEVIDYGESFDLDGWNWYTRFMFSKMTPYKVKTSNFNTRIHGNVAYATFNMGGFGPVEVASAVLLRNGDKWLIDLLQIEKQQVWEQWLRDRVNNGKDVSNWFNDYLKDKPYR